MTPSRRKLLQGAGALAAASALPVAHANTDYPKGTVKIVVTFAPGGATDTVGRLLADRLGKVLGGTFVVENKPGASGMLGTELISKSPADGHTLGVVLSGVVFTNPHIYTKVPYKVDDLTLLYRILNATGILVVNPSVPVKTMQELAAYLKANPNKLSFGSYGQGSYPHMVCEYLRKEHGLEMNHVPYKGEAPMVQDLLAGQIQVGYGSVAVQSQHIAAGKIRPIATLTPERLAALPNLPTMAEQGFKDDAFRMDSWFGLIGPKGIPVAVQEKIGEAMRKIMSAPDVQDTILKMGYVAVPNSSPAKVKADYDEWAPRWKKLAEISGAKIDQ